MWVRTNLFSRMPATAQSLGLSMFGTTVVMRWSASTLRASLRTLHSADVSLLPRLRTLSKAGQLGEWRVVMHGQGSAFAGRLCAVRKVGLDFTLEEQARITVIAQELRTVLEFAKKRQQEKLRSAS